MKPIDISKLNEALQLLNEQLVLIVTQDTSEAFRMILKDMFNQLGWQNVSEQI